MDAAELPALAGVPALPASAGALALPAPSVGASGASGRYRISKRKGTSGGEGKAASPRREEPPEAANPRFRAERTRVAAEDDDEDADMDLLDLDGED